MAFLGVALLCLATFYVTWPLGPDYVDEGGVTSLRLGVAGLAMVGEFGILSLGFCTALILRRLNGLEARWAKSPGQPAASAP